MKEHWSCAYMHANIRYVSLCHYHCKDLTTAWKKGSIIDKENYKCAGRKIPFSQKSRRWTDKMDQTFWKPVASNLEYVFSIQTNFKILHRNTIINRLGFSNASEVCTGSKLEETEIVAYSFVLPNHLHQGSPTCGPQPISNQAMWMASWCARVCALTAPLMRASQALSAPLMWALRVLSAPLMHAHMCVHVPAPPLKPSALPPTLWVASPERLRNSDLHSFSIGKKREVRGSHIFSQGNSYCKIFGVMMWHISWQTAEPALWVIPKPLLGDCEFTRIILTNPFGFIKGWGTEDIFSNGCWIIEKAKEF